MSFKHQLGIGRIFPLPSGERVLVVVANFPLDQYHAGYLAILRMDARAFAGCAGIERLEFVQGADL
jgi:hypothetical protein